jgi:hypothetical protein
MPPGRPRKTAGERSQKNSKGSGNGANLGLEAPRFLAADQLHKTFEPSDHKHVALGLIFLKQVSNAFEVAAGEFGEEFRGRCNPARRCT